MNKAMLIIYEPALFLLAGLGWAAWEFWSMRTKKGPAEKPEGEGDASKLDER